MNFNRAMIMLGVIIMLEFMGKIFINTPGNKKFLIYTVALAGIMLVMSTSNVFFYALYGGEERAASFSNLAMQAVTGAIAMFLTAYFILRKYLKKQNKVYLKEYLPSFASELWLAALVVYLTLISVAGEFFGLTYSVNVIIKFRGIVLSVFTLIISFMSFSKICKALLISKLLEDEQFSKQIKKQTEEKGFIVTGKDITADFLYLLDFQVYWVLNRSEIKKLKPDDTAFIKISDEVIEIYEKLKSEKARNMK